MEEIVRLILESKLIDAGTDAAAQKSMILGGILAPIFFLATVVWNFATTTIKNVGERPQLFNRMELIRACVLWFILTIGYFPIFGSLANIGEALGRYSVDSSTSVKNGKEKMSGYVTKELEKEAEASKEQAGEDANTNTEEQQPEDTMSAWDLVTGGINTFIFASFSAGTLIISSIIRIVVEAFALMISKLFYAIGPIVIAFSILPVFKDKFSQWFGVYVNCLCVPFTCNLLDTIYYSIINAGLTGEAVANPIALSVFNLVFIICYCLVFWVTSFYAGSSGAAKVLSTAVGAATTAISMGAGALAGGAASAAGGAGGGGGNIIEDSAGATNKAK
jgi:hypothetical protein